MTGSKNTKTAPSGFAKRTAQQAAKEAFEKQLAEGDSRNENGPS